MACMLHFQHLAFALLFLLCSTLRLARQELHWLIWLDPVSLLAEALQSYRHERVQYVSPGGFLAICNCLSGVHNAFSTQGVQELLLALVLWEARVCGLNVGILHFLEVLVCCAARLQLLFLDWLVVSAAVGHTGVAADGEWLLPRLSASHQKGWARSIERCVASILWPVSWRGLCASAAMATPLAALQWHLHVRGKGARERRGQQQKKGGGAPRSFDSVLASLEGKKE